MSFNMVEINLHNMEKGEVLLAPFSRVRIINLPYRKDRRKEVARALAKIGLSTDHPKIKFFSAISPEETAGFAKVGIRGCFLSHLEILKKSLSDQVESVLLLEDDADFDLPDVAEISAMLKPLKNNSWDIIYLGYHYPNRFMDAHGAGVHSFGGRYNIGGAHAIAFSQRVLPKIVPYLEQVETDLAAGVKRPMHVDEAYSTFRAETENIITLVASPAFSFQRRSVSDVQDLKWYDKVPGISAVSNALRRMLWRRKS